MNPSPKPKPGTLPYAKYRWELFRSVGRITNDRLRQIIFIVAAVRGQVAVSQRRPGLPTLDELSGLLKTLRFPVTQPEGLRVSELLDKAISESRNSDP